MLLERPFGQKTSTSVLAEVDTSHTAFKHLIDKDYAPILGYIDCLQGAWGGARWGR